ncbi:MAG: UDP-N-acetylglucosamine 2-epimerase (non-hydrolyzing) [Proteobacteria bacterium]|nr:UDP-N-acetylglucosamine 2-epimerase (non-hydrolyzing) [Pseudomonadota bacterium]
MKQRKKITVILGTRPEAIKLAPVILALKEHPELDTRVCVTAQHREMLDQVLEVFGIVPDTDLNLMKERQTLGDFTARAIRTLTDYLEDDKADMVLVQGDTTTVFCGTLASFYNRIPVGHVEAGLRTHNLYSPWPEEANRVLTSHLAALHFAPTEASRQNLISEGISQEIVFVTGNTVIDALLMAAERVKIFPPHIPGIDPGMMVESNKTPLVLITGHRRENFGVAFEAICLAIIELALRFPEVNFVYPVHLNPNVREPVNRILRSAKHKNIHLIEPLPYLPFVAMMLRATLILTDSGGIQEEAPSLGKPVLVMRETTERPEAVDTGSVKLVGTDRGKIISEVSLLLNDETAYRRMSMARNPYGDGQAANRIADILSTPSDISSW